MMPLLAVLVVASEAEFSIEAVVNPFSLRCWDSTGQPLKRKLPERLLRSMKLDRRVEPVYEKGTYRRFVVVRINDPFPSRDANLMLTSPNMAWNRGFLPGYVGSPHGPYVPGNDPHYEVFECRILFGQMRINLEADTEAGFWTTLVSGTVYQGRLRPSIGGQRKPVLFEVPPGYEMSPDCKLRKSQNAGGEVRATRYLLRYNDGDLVGKGGSRFTRIWDRNGRLFSPTFSSGLAGSYSVDGGEGSPKQIARVEVRWRPTRKLMFKNVRTTPK